MIKIENTKCSPDWKSVIMGLRNPMNSWDRSDSLFLPLANPSIGEKDLDLMLRLAKSGNEQRKFLRMIPVYMDITAPLYWWKEADTYKVGTVSNSCSTMHKIQTKEFTINDFSHEHLDNFSISILENIIDALNSYRDKFNITQNKDDWWQMIQLLPSSYNQKRTLFLNYEVLRRMYHQRKYHKLDEWREFCKEIEKLPYSELITAES